VGSELMGSSSRFEKTVALCGRGGMMQFCVQGPRGDFFLRRGADRVKGFLCEKFAWNAGTGQPLAVSWTSCQFSRK